MGVKFKIQYFLCLVSWNIESENIFGQEMTSMHWLEYAKNKDKNFFLWR